MKKVLFMAAAFAAFVACSRTDDSSVDPASGDLITLTASFDMSEINAQPDDPTTAGVDFHWEPGDSVFVTDSKECKVFRIIDSSIDKNTASFIGEALSGGMKDYDVYYGINPSEAAGHQDVRYIPQSFDPRAYGKGSGTSFELSTFYPVLKLQLKGSMKLGKIEYVAGSDTTVMSFPEGLQLASDDITVVYFTPMHITAEGFTINFYTTDDVKLMKNGSPTDLQDSYGKILAMPVLAVGRHYIEDGNDYGSGISCAGVTWAPVNCGVSTDPLGLHYQWGRKYGQRYQGSGMTVYSPLVSSLTIAEGNSSEHEDDFFEIYDDGSEHNHNWWSDSGVDLTLWNANGADSDAVPVKTSYDPCPDGWRVPTGSEMQALIDYARGGFVQERGDRYSMNWPGIEIYEYGYPNAGIVFINEEGETLFFPLPGRIGISDYDMIRKNVDGKIAYKCVRRSEEHGYGYYWTSTAQCKKTVSGATPTIDCFTGKGMYLAMGGEVMTMFDNGLFEIEPAAGLSVRCVQDKMLN